jgi:hypothetical protein
VVWAVPGALEHKARRRMSVRPTLPSWLGRATARASSRRASRRRQHGAAKEGAVWGAPQYASAFGKAANCQTLVSLTPARDEVPVMIGLRH